MQTHIVKTTPFQKMLDFITKETINAALIGLGGAAAAFHWETKKSFTKALIMLSVGAMTSMFVGLAVCEHIESDRLCTFVEFSCGIGGMRIVAAILKIFASIEKKPLAWVKWLTGKDNVPNDKDPEQEA